VALMADADIDNLGDHVSSSTASGTGYGRFRELVIFGGPLSQIGAKVSPRTVAITERRADRRQRVHWLRESAGRRGSGPAAMADRDQGRGYYTRALLAGLRGGAVDPDHGVVTSTTLAQFVAQAVEAATRGVVIYPQKAEHKLDPAHPILFGGAGQLITHARPSGSRLLPAEPPRWPPPPNRRLGCIERPDGGSARQLLRDHPVRRLDRQMALVVGANVDVQL
jgi:hypothetical protein